MDAIEDLHADADAAHVPWSYALSDRAATDPAYRRWLAHHRTCDSIGVDPRHPPAVLGDPHPTPPNLEPRMVERDLAALTDYSCRPLHDFATTRAALRPHSGADRDRPIPPQ